MKKKLLSLWLITMVALSLCVVSVTASLSPGGSAPQYVKDEIIVRFKPEAVPSGEVTAQVAAEVNAEVGATVVRELPGVPGAQLVKLPSSTTVASAIATYSRNPNVLYAEPNYIVHADAVPNDPSFSQLWGLDNTGQTVNGVRGTSDADVDAPDAWSLITGTSAASVVVAVVDSGVDYTHPDLASNMVPGWNFLANSDDPMDDYGHGTHVAGTIAAVGNNGVGVTGVMWLTQAKIMPLKFLDSTGSGTIANAVAAINYANSNGAQIISNSWGGTGFSQALKDAIDASPAVVCCAAGNGQYFGRNDDSTPFYPASYTSSNIIAVAATDQNDRLASWSNYGATSVDVAAPGVNIYSTSRSGSYGFLSGTSMATPHVSGIAGLVTAMNPGYTAAQIKSAVLNGVEAKTSLSGKILTGGRVNAFKAINNKTPTTLTATASKSSVAVGEEFIVSGALTAGSVGLSGKTIKLFNSTNGGSMWTDTGKTCVTVSAGTYSFAVSEASSGTHTYKASFAGVGDSTYAPSESTSVNVTVGASGIALGDAVDITSLQWTTGGNADWFGETATYYYGGDAAQSGAISDGQTTWLSTTVTGPGTIRFYWKVSSDSGDYLNFTTDSSRRSSISGSVNWQSKSFSVSSGTHTLTWTYSKNAAGFLGADAGWLDRVIWTRSFWGFSSSVPSTSGSQLLAGSSSDTEGSVATMSVADARTASATGDSRLLLL